MPQTVHCHTCSMELLFGDVYHFGEHRYCADCYFEVVRICDECGRAVPVANIIITESGEQYCARCEPHCAIYGGTYESLEPTTHHIITSHRTCGPEIEFIYPNTPRASASLKLYGQVKSDGSVVDDDGIGAELCLHPTSGDRLITLITDACRDLKRIGCYTNETCGLHIHLGVSNDFVKRRRILYWWRLFEDLFFSMVHQDRRRSEFCEPVMDASFDTVAENRYHSLNVSSYERHRTFECRIHHGTIDPTLIIGWCQLLISFFDTFEGVPLSRVRRNEIERMNQRERLIFLFQQLHIPLSLRKHIVRRLATFHTLRPITLLPRHRYDTHIEQRAA